ncbi:DUF2905 domain-containing protein [Piscinibacter sp. Jin2]|uniref:DUF2905 domain-containing protein n=1 Tax=Aquariibacter lacus TaxID=2801332 RepID=A0A9X0XEF2_9BURK|nr:DUF2905 domain-containing protein [Piscinibacter lacus]MBL0720792.1 DUF2905 domain-containing protein [Piscinibacter lacus]
MLRWLIVTVLALLLFQGLQPWLRKLGLGRLPGDLAWRWKGKVWNLPLASCALLSLIAMGLAKLL